MSHPPIKKKMSQGKPWLLPLALVLLVIWLGWRFGLAYQPEPVRLRSALARGPGTPPSEPRNECTL